MVGGDLPATGTSYSEGNITLGTYNDEDDSWVAVDSATGDVFASTGAFDSVKVIDPVNNSVVGTVPISGSTGALVYVPTTQDIYVASSDDDVVVISASTLQVVATIPVCPGPDAFAYDSANGDLYVGCVGSAPTFHDGGMTVIDAESGTDLTNLTLGVIVWGLSYDSYDKALDLSTSTGYVEVYSTVSLTEEYSIEVGSEFSIPYALAYDAFNGNVYVPLYGGDNVTIFNATTGQIVGNLTLGTEPEMAAINPMNGEVLITNALSSNVTVINGSTEEAVASLPVQGGAQGIAWNPINDEIYVANYISATVTYIRPLQDGDLISLTVAPTSATIAVGSTSEFTATPTCWNEACAAGVTYSWSQSGAALGSFISASSDPTVFSSGSVDGTEAIFANATWHDQTVEAAAVPLTVGPSQTLLSVSVTPTVGSIVQAGGRETFTAVPVCQGTPCSSSIGYEWSLSNTDAYLSAGSGSSTTVNAGPTAPVGTDTLFLNATLGATTLQAAPVTVSITAAPPAALSSVRISPNGANLEAGGTSTFTALPLCSNDGACPMGTLFVWTLEGSLGSLNTTTGSVVQFNAGSTRGSEQLSVNATLGNRSATFEVTLTVGGEPVGSSRSGGLGSLGSASTDLLLLGIVAVIVVVVVAVVLVSRRRPPPPPSPPTPVSAPVGPPPPPPVSPM